MKKKIYQDHLNDLFSSEYKKAKEESNYQNNFSKYKLNILCFSYQWVNIGLIFENKGSHKTCRKTAITRTSISINAKTILNGIKRHTSSTKLPCVNDCYIELCILFVCFLAFKKQILETENSTLKRLGKYMLSIIFKRTCLIKSR